jgi:pimeloyl-ACP methyl ester carboxylesterase
MKGRCHVVAAPDDARQRFRTAQQDLFARHSLKVSSHFLRLPEPPMRVHLLELGSGPPTLLIHGGNSVAAVWAPLLQALQAQFHLYAPDRPGCGLSDPVDYARVADFHAHAIAFVRSTLDALGLARAHVIGNSMGGLWALLFALAYPERVDRLVLLGEPAGASRVPLPRHRVLGTPLVNRLLYATKLRPERARTRQQLRAVMVHPERVSEELLDVVHAATVLPDAQRAWLSMLERVARPGRRVELTYSLHPQLARLQIPVLLVWGEQDPVAPVWGQQLVDSLPNAHLVVLPDTGHLPWLDEPERVGALVQDFLCSTSASNSPSSPVLA